MSNPTPLNQQTLALLQSLEDDKPGSLAELIRMFVADAPTLLSRIEVAHERRDLGELRRASHYLRSAALALGADALALAALDVEHLDEQQIGTAEGSARLPALRSGLRNAIVSLLEVTPEL
jgi:HPt (histidine-containing phosphotransfer) domain-containing protein